MSYTWAFLQTLVIAAEHIAPILLTLIGLIVINGLVIGRLEHWKTSDAIYHAFINATTVGYGDFRPERGLSKGLCVINAFVGLLLTGIFVGAGVYAVQEAFAVLPPKS